MIYANRKEAIAAREKFFEELEALKNKYGVELWENDDCAGSGYEIGYYDANGIVVYIC